MLLIFNVSIKLSHLTADTRGIYTAMQQ